MKIAQIHKYNYLIPVFPLQNNYYDFTTHTLKLIVPKKRFQMLVLRFFIYNK